MNTGELIWPSPEGAAVRVRAMQTKLHHWAVKDSDRLFDDVLTSSATRISSPLRGAGSGGTRVHAPPVLTGVSRRLSPRAPRLWSFWGRYGSS